MRPVIALSLAAGLVAPLAMAPPAQAAGGTVAGPVINAIQSFFAVISGGGSIATAFQQIAAEIQQAQASILQEIDQVATANVQACATANVDNFSNINLLTPANLQLFAENAIQCVAEAQTTINAITPSNEAAIDALGFAMNTVGPLAIVSSEMAGFSVSGVDGTLVAGENALITDLLPACDFEDLTGLGFFRWVCTAYNGDEGVGKLITNAQNMATVNTSRAIALAEVGSL